MDVGLMEAQMAMGSTGMVDLGETVNASAASAAISMSPLQQQWAGQQLGYAPITPVRNLLYDGLRFGLKFPW